MTTKLSQIDANYAVTYVMAAIFANIDDSAIRHLSEYQRAPDCTNWRHKSKCIVPSFQKLTSSEAIVNHIGERLKMNRTFQRIKYILPEMKPWKNVEHYFKH